MSVTCPGGVGPGGLVSITTPSGQQMTVAVPAGVSPGQVFTVQIAGEYAGQYNTSIGP